MLDGFIEALKIVAFLFLILLIVPGTIVIHWDLKRANRRRHRRMQQLTLRAERAVQALSEAQESLRRASRDESKLQIRCDSLLMTNERLEKRLKEEQIRNTRLTAKLFQSLGTVVMKIDL